MECLICQQQVKYVFPIKGYNIFECTDCSQRMTRPDDLACMLNKYIRMIISIAEIVGILIICMKES